MSTPPIGEYLGAAAGLKGLKRAEDTATYDALDYPFDFAFEDRSSVGRIKPLGSGIGTEEPPYIFGAVQHVTGTGAWVTMPSQVGSLPNVMEFQNQTTKAIQDLSDRMDRLAAAISILSRGTETDEFGTHMPYAESSQIDASDIPSVLARASDLGIFDENLVALAEGQMDSDDQFARLAAIRVIALSDPDRGRQIIEHALADNDNPTIGNALSAILKAIS